MDPIKIIVSFCELLITIALAIGVVYMTLRALIKTNTDFDEDKELLRGNVAVGVLVAALLLASANIMNQAFRPVAETIHLYLTSPLVEKAGQWKLVLHSIANLVLAFFIVVFTMSFSLRVIGRLMRNKDSRPGKELEKGNVAIGVVLSGVVLIVSLFVGEGVKALSKALIPKPNVGRMQIMR